MSYDHIPEILRHQPQWVVWGIVGEPPKAPFQPKSLARLMTVPARSGDPGTWGTFADAVDCVDKGLAQGIGYEFSGQGVYGVDLDDVRNDNGAINPQAREIVEQLNSYTEVSPSGRGLHIFVTADHVNITRHRRQGGFVEIYGNARYFTVTGDIYGDFDHMAERSDELQRVHDRYLLPERTRSATASYPVESAQGDFLQRGLAKDLMLRACWNGDRRRGDESASDLALMNKLGYWLSGNLDAMCAAFLQSPYFAQKDEPHKKKCQRSDYLPNTARAACATLRSTAYEDTMRYRQSRDEAR